MIKDEISENVIDVLFRLNQDDLSNDPVQHRDTVKTLFTITNNLLSKPLDPSVRRLNKTNKAV